MTVYCLFVFECLFSFQGGGRSLYEGVYELQSMLEMWKDT